MLRSHSRTLSLGEVKLELASVDLLEAKVTKLAPFLRSRKYSQLQPSDAKGRLATFSTTVLYRCISPSSSSPSSCEFERMLRRCRYCGVKIGGALTSVARDDEEEEER